jgi:catechol 2,3-dioxygenase-like lactoylglutathione lyase family enzyme
MKANWEHGHTGVFTRDFDKTLHYYKALGLAPELGPRQRAPRSPSDKFVNIEFGQVVDNYIDPNTPFLELLYVGDLEFEVLHAPRQRPAGEALAYGEGVNHVCFLVSDIDGETDKLVNKGLRIIQDASLNGVRIEDYLDTRAFGNILLSLRPPQTREMNARKAGYGIVDWKYLGVGAVVKDVEKTVKYYQSMDIATFQPAAMFDSTAVHDLKIHGKSSRDIVLAKTRSMQIGPVIYELTEPVTGEAIFRESLDRRGEGIINLTFSVENLEHETGKMAEKGVPTVFSGKPRSGQAFAYLDTRRDGGDVMIQLVQR